MTINPRFMYQEKNILCYKKLHKLPKTIINLLVNLTLILILSSRTPSSFCVYMHQRTQIWKLWACFKVTYHNISTKYMHWKEVQKYSIS